MTGNRVATQRNGMYCAAILSPCGTWRYRLDRIWDRTKNQCVWICLNPSIATESIDDPTVRKITGFSARMGYGGFALLNLFALRSTDPKGLLSHFNPVGPDNGAWRIKETWNEISNRSYTHPPIVAWGSIHKKHARRAAEVAQSLSVVRCLGFTKSGWPRHPLMLRYDTKVQTIDASRWLNHLPPT